MSEFPPSTPPLGPTPDAAIPAVPAPAAVPGVRIADADRDRVVALLRHHVGEGRITLDEFAERVGVVFAARTSGELEQVTVDLPAIGGDTVPMPATEGAVRTTRTTRRARAVHWVVSIFSGNQQKGRWRVEREVVSISIFGGSTLDLREAEVVGEEATITCIAVFGGADVIVPEGIEVVLTGVSLFGGKSLAVADVPIIPGSPLIRVQAFSLFGGCTVRSKGPKQARVARPSGRRERDAALGAARDAREMAREQARAARDQARQLRQDMREQARAGRHGGSTPRSTPAMPPPPGIPSLDDPPLAGGAFGATVPPPARPVPHGIDAVADTIEREWPELRRRVAPEGTVTILFSDIAGFTGITEQMGDMRAGALLREHYRIVRDELERHRGFEVKVQGDGFMVAFDSASRALRCAVAIQRSQEAWNAEHPDTPLDIRMGLHTGEAIRDADDFLGSTVNLASRIADRAVGGEILVSALLRELCASSGEFRFAGGDAVTLKGLSQPQRVYDVLWR